MKVILETERLFLREMNMDDFDALYVVLADSDVVCSTIHILLIKKESENG